MFAGAPTKPVINVGSYVRCAVESTSTPVHWMSNMQYTFSVDKYFNVTSNDGLIDITYSNEQSNSTISCIGQEIGSSYDSGWSETIEVSNKFSK